MSEKISQSNAGTWLSKEGKIFGPYSPKEIELLKNEGKFSEYTWMWAPGSNQWAPITPAPAPPLPPGKQVVQSEFKTRHPLDKTLEVICHDQKNIVSGKIQCILDNGFVMTSKDFSESSPPFHQGRHVWLNLLDEANGSTENIRAEIVKIERKDQTTWSYEFQWKEVPKILEK